MDENQMITWKEYVKEEIEEIKWRRTRRNGVEEDVPCDRARSNERSYGMEIDASRPPKQNL